MHYNDFCLQSERRLHRRTGRGLIEARGLIGQGLVLLNVTQDELALVDGVAVDPGFCFGEKGRVVSTWVVELGEAHQLQHFPRSLPPSLLLKLHTGGVDDGAHGGDGFDGVLPLGTLA